MFVCVTLYVRVWIETVETRKAVGEKRVTLYVRVWIETVKLLNALKPPPCHPLREGVDWNLRIIDTTKLINVTLYVRVWIETNDLL